MGIIAKYIIKSMAEKKGRTTLIIFSIMISASLYFASVSISDCMVKMAMESYRQNYGYSDIIIEQKWNSPSPYFNTSGSENYKNYMDYLIGEVTGFGTYKVNATKKQGITIKGMDLEDINKITPIELYKEYNVKPFEGKKLIISKAVSEKYGLKIGETMNLEINGNLHKFLISGISQPMGPFRSDAKSPVAVIPRETAAKLYGMMGKVNRIYIKLISQDTKSDMISQLSLEYPRYTVREPFTEKEIKAEADKIAVPFKILTVILSFMSIYIIYSTFNVIVLERLPVIGTFRSVGATKRKTTLMLVSESLFYGVLGGLLSWILGIVILYIMSYFTRPIGSNGVKIIIDFKVGTLAISFLISVFLALISSMIPILKASRKPIKDIVLNSTSTKEKKKYFRVICGFIFLAGSIVLPHVFIAKESVAINTICILLTLLSVILLIPFLTKLLVWIFHKLYVIIFGNEGIIAVSNLRENKSFLNNISLITIGIASMMMINTLSDSVVKELEQYFKAQNYQVLFYMNNVSRSNLINIKTTEGVKDVFGVLCAYGTPIQGQDSTIGTIQGVDQDRYLQFVSLNKEIDAKKFMEKLDEGRNIIIGKRLQDKFDLKVGDELPLIINGIVIPYKIISIVNTLESNGDYGLISELNFKSDFKTKNYSMIFVKTDQNPLEVQKELQLKFSKQGPEVDTKDHVEDAIMKSNKQILIIVEGFSILALLAGILGVFNNLFIAFIQRKRSTAMYRSIGMDKTQLIKISFIEALTGGVIGGILGVTTSILMTLTMKKILEQIQLNIDITYSVLVFVICFAVAVLISVLGSIIPTIKSSKINLIEAIKYE